MTTLEKRIENLASLLATATNERADALKKNANLLGQLEEKDARIRTLEDGVASLTADLDDRAARITGLTDRITGLTDRIKALEAELREPRHPEPVAEATTKKKEVPK